MLLNTQVPTPQIKSRVLNSRKKEFGNVTTTLPACKMCGSPLIIVFPFLILFLTNCLLCVLWLYRLSLYCDCTHCSMIVIWMYVLTMIVLWLYWLWLSSVIVLSLTTSVFCDLLLVMYWLRYSFRWLSSIIVRNDYLLLLYCLRMSSAIVFCDCLLWLYWMIVFYDCTDDDCLL